MKQIAASLGIALAASATVAHASSAAHEPGRYSRENAGGDSQRTRQECLRALNNVTTRFHKYAYSDVGFIKTASFACKVDLNTRTLIKSYNLKSYNGLFELAHDSKNTGVTAPPTTTAPNQTSGLTAGEKCEAARMKRQPLALKFQKLNIGFVQGTGFACKINLRPYNISEVYDLQTAQGRQHYEKAVQSADAAEIDRDIQRYKEVTGHPPLWHRPPVSGPILHR